MRVLTLALAALAFAPSAWGGDLDNLSTLNQGQFRLLSEDMASAFSYRPMGPAAPLGFPGFELGAGVTSAKLKHPELLQLASTENTPDTLYIPALRANIGLPLGLDIGGTYSQIPSTDITYYGLQAKWAFVPGSTFWPALGVRGSYTKVSGVDDLTLDTKGVDMSISKGIGFATPYVGVGRVYARSDPKGVAGLSKEEFNMNKLFGGLTLKFLFFDFTLEADKTGDVSAYSAKLSLKF